MMDEDRENLIRQRAYELWEADGSPEGRHLDHWDTAKREIEDGAGAAPATKATKKAAPKKAGAKPAAKKSPLADAGAPGGTAGTGGTAREQDR